MSASSNPEEKNKTLGGTLYLVATPIGNLSDVSARAVKVLSEVDLVAAEDTRNSGRLLQALGVSKPMISYFEHNKSGRGKELIGKLRSGLSVALVTDAGTPAISDPGADLVRLCIDEGIPVTSLPGCCAAVNALILSGMDTKKFQFEGFPEHDEKARRASFEELAACRRTMIFYEAPHRLRQTLGMMKDAFGGERRIALCREMTKLNEEICRTTLEEACAFYDRNPPRGEYVLVLSGSDGEKAPFFENMTVAEHVQFYIDNGLSRMDAMKAAAKDRGVGKGEIYKQML